MTQSPYLRQDSSGTSIAIRVTPRASRNEIGLQHGDELKIKISAPPVDSAANTALLCFLSEILDCPKSAVQLVRGASSRSKVIRVIGLTMETIQDRLNKARPN